MTFGPGGPNFLCPLRPKLRRGRHKPLTISNWDRVVKVDHKLLRKTSEKKIFFGKKLGENAPITCGLDTAFVFILILKVVLSSFFLLNMCIILDRKLGTEHLRLSPTSTLQPEEFPRSLISPTTYRNPQLIRIELNRVH